VSRRLVVEADGGARGNPGPAAYGAVVRDPDTGQVLAEVAEAIGVATNNVAEYRGLVAGLEAAHAINPAAAVQVRMDSKLVVEQMSGRWRIKNADLKPLAEQARRAFPPDQVSYTWVPREQNTHADRLLNRALDGGGNPGPASGAVQAVEAARPPTVPGVADLSTATTMLLVRHGRTTDTVARRFAGGGVPGAVLDAEGKAQAERAAAELAGFGAVAVVSSPLLRARQTAETIATWMGLELLVDPEWRECDFGEWEGLVIDQVAERYRDRVIAWRDSTAEAPPGGESLEAMSARVFAARDGVLDRFSGEAAIVVTHSLPIRALVCDALGAPLTAIHQLRPAPGSVTELLTYAGGTSITGFGLRPSGSNVTA
jgi:ribonuclease H / adenosylcobalamin/alpha-ribazole phosphatase